MKFQSGKNHINWKGGNSRCKTCNKETSGRGIMYCWEHHIENNFKEKHWNWKGGKPVCKCGKVLCSRKNKMCVPCSGKSRRQKNHYSWVNGNYKKSDRLSADSASYYWRRDVKTRDGYKCKINNKDCKGKIEAHHILPWRDYVELRYDINNGIALCHFHHPRKWEDEKRLSPYFMELVSVSKEQN